LFEERALPMLRRWKVEVIGYGPSPHDDLSYYLIRGYASLEDRQRSQDAFYGSDEWRQGPRESILALIDSYASVVLDLDAAGLDALRAAGPLHAAPGAADEAELRQLTQQLLDAVAPGQAAVWERILHERFVHMDENGAVRGKAALLAELAPLPPGLVGRMEIDTFRAQVHGRTAVTAYEIQEYLDYHGQPLRTRFRSVDTWLKEPAGWRLAAQHTAAVLKDPPAVRLTRQELCEYEGVYELTPALTTTIRCTEDGLASERSGRPPARYSAEVRDVFFVAGQPRTRRLFTRDARGRVDGFVDRREGEDVRWKKTAARGG
ncbi:MAG TPA: nuclear transport factor 2 family protein, partial [Vicinamibacteria bacterium]|nr:nuclear transport factor 2 family protein [Vicinamibacteria bacterium]